jgi:hypothetical protein
MSTSDAGRRAARLARVAVLALLAAAVSAPARADPPTLSPAIPGDADVAKGKSIAAYDDFAWRTFVALNWPADGKGPIGQGGDGAARWQGWKQDTDLLVFDGDRPPAWDKPTPVPPICQAAKPPGGRVPPTGINPGVLAVSRMPSTGPLIDQNGQYVRYEILMNRPMYDFIRDNELYTRAGQQAFMPGSGIAFPSGSAAKPDAGAIMLKAAWKILGPGDDPGRFHSALAYIYEASPPPAPPTCTLQLVGLVGLHISHKTDSAPQWVWSTFEHVDNAPTDGQAWKGRFNFNNGHDDPTKLPWNQVPTGVWDPATGDKHPVQVVRLKAIATETAARNADYAAALRHVDQKSVFANYLLVGAQYPQRPPTAVNPNGEPRPEILANSTMETFLQRDVPPVSSNCLACHGGATMSDARASDFTYILSRVSRK